VKRRVIRLSWSKVFGYWVTADSATGVAFAGATKREAETKARARCRRLGKSQWVQLVCHGKNGRIQWEATYPRDSDPRRTPG
jgi:hypothetical protein